MRNKFANTLYELGKKDERICILVADISPAGSIKNFREKFPKRFINTGVSEQSMVGIASGLALKGFKPFCYTISTFSLYRPFEFIRVDLCYQNLPVVIIGMGAGTMYSTLGATHQTIEDIAIASALPNMTVLAPCDPLEMEEAIKWCVNENSGPVYMRLGKTGEPDLTSKSVERFKVGKKRIIKEGKDIAIISYGVTLKKAFEIEKKLSQKKYQTSIISNHTLKPFDNEGIKSVLENHKKIIVIEDHVPQGGLSTKVKDVALQITKKPKIFFFTLKDKFSKVYGDQSDLHSDHGLSNEAILKEILKDEKKN